MEIRIEKNVLINVLNKIGKISKHIIFFHENGSLYAINELIQCDEILKIKLGDVNQFNPFKLGVNYFLNIIKSIDDETIVITMSDKKNIIKIADKKKKYSLTIDENANVFNVKITNKKENQKIDIGKMLEYAPHLLSIIDTSGIQYQGILIKDHYMISTDGRRVYKVKIDEQFSAPVVILSLKPFLYGEVNYSIEENILYFYDDTTIYGVSLLDFVFPDLKDIFSGYGEKYFFVDSEFNKIISDALLIDGVLRKTIFKVKNDKIEIKSLSELGEFTANYNCPQAGCGEIEFSANGDFIKSAVSFVNDFHPEPVCVYFKKNNNALYFKTKDSHIEILCMPLKHEEVEDKI